MTQSSDTTVPDPRLDSRASNTHHRKSKTKTQSYPQLRSHPISKPEYLVLHSLSLISPRQGEWRCRCVFHARFFCFSLVHPSSRLEQWLVEKLALSYFLCRWDSAEMVSDNGWRQAGRVVMLKPG